MRQLVRVTWAFLARDASIAMSYRLDFVLKAIGIVFAVLALYFISTFVGNRPEFAEYGGYLPFALAGIAVLSFFQTGFTTFSSAIRSEQVTGTLESILMTPARISSIIIASSAWSFISAVINIILCFFFACYVFKIPINGNIPVALLLLGLATLVSISLGIISASFVMVFKRGDPLSFSIGALSSLFGGIFFPVEKLPSWLAKAAYLLPITHASSGVREVLFKHATFAQVLPQTLVLAGFSIVCVPLSFYLFQKALRCARREGTLLQY